MFSLAPSQVGRVQNFAYGSWSHSLGPLPGTSSAPMSLGQLMTTLQYLTQACASLQQAWTGALSYQISAPGSNYFAPNSYAGSPYSGSPALGGMSGAWAAALSLDWQQRQVPSSGRKMWDVWFDSKQGQTTVQRSPLVLDLNSNGKADITGKNVTGDGKIDGPTTLFDLDPNQISFELKSQQRRPGSGAPAVPGGYWLDAQGNRVESGPPKGTQPKFNGYQYKNAQGELVGQMIDGLYHYGKQEKREATEWLKKGGGDGLLVVDFDGDGQINSAVELFGTEGQSGQRFANGFEKLGALFDHNRDGVVRGQELQGLQVWADSNADGQVQDGELQSLDEHNITELNASQYDPVRMEGSFVVGGGQYSQLEMNVALALSGSVYPPSLSHLAPWLMPGSY